jgi:hypothetical protein
MQKASALSETRLHRAPQQSISRRSPSNSRMKRTGWRPPLIRWYVSRSFLNCPGSLARGKIVRVAQGPSVGDFDVGVGRRRVRVEFRAPNTVDFISRRCRGHYA